MESGREQEQSIKQRKAMLYEDDAPAVVRGPSKPFAEYLRETPAAPLSPAIQAALWAAGIVVVLLLVAALIRPAPPKAKAKRKAEAAVPILTKAIA